MTGYLSSGDVKRITGITQATLNGMCWNGIVNPTLRDAARAGARRGVRFFTMEDFEKIVYHKWGPSCLKEIVIKCPHCDKIIKISYMNLLKKSMEYDIGILKKMNKKALRAV